MSNSCEACNRSFGSGHALRQHLQDSPAHKPTFYCETCNKWFGSEMALNQHTQASPVHSRPPFRCNSCEKSFYSNEALQKHLQDSFTDQVEGHYQDIETESEPSEIFPELHEDVLDALFDTMNSLNYNSNYEDDNDDIETESEISEMYSELHEDVLDALSGTMNLLNFDYDHDYNDDDENNDDNDEDDDYDEDDDHDDIEAEPKLFEMFPELHENVLEAISDAMISPIFNHNDDDDSFDSADNEYSTNVMGDFTCNDHRCAHVWSSKKVAIVIRGYPGDEYNAAVYYQRCNSCKELGTLRNIESSYVERVAYRLKKWAGAAAERPFYGGKRGLPHKRELCEGCKAGYCQEDDLEEED